MLNELSPAPVYASVGADDLDLDAVHHLYEASTLADRRPVGEPGRLAAMLRGSNLIITATVADRLVGISRSLSDFSYVTYLADLAVDRELQGKGIGQELVRLTGAAAPTAKIVLLSAPGAATYYPHIGFTQHGSAWTLAAAG